LEQCVNVDYKCSIIVNVIVSVVNEHSTTLCEVIKLDDSQIHLVLKLTDEILELNRLDERSEDKLKSLRTKPSVFWSDDNVERIDGILLKSFYRYAHSLTRSSIHIWKGRASIAARKNCIC
jgi:hypothetical protein